MKINFVFFSAISRFKSFCTNCPTSKLPSYKNQSIALNGKTIDLFASRVLEIFEVKGSIFTTWVNDGIGVDSLNPFAPIVHEKAIHT